MKLKLFSVVAAVAVMLSGSVASATPYTTAGASSPSTLTLELFLNGSPVSAIPPIAINGTLDVTTSLDGSGDGLLSILSANLLLDDVSGTILGGLATINTSSVGMSITTDSAPVTGNAWNLTTDPPLAFELSLNQGSLVIAGAFNENVDLNTDPISLDLADVAPFNINGIANGSELSIFIPSASMPLDDVLAGLSVTLTGEIHAIAVPEPATIALLGMSALGLIPVVRRRLRK